MNDSLRSITEVKEKSQTFLHEGTRLVCLSNQLVELEEITGKIIEENVHDSTNVFIHEEVLQEVAVQIDFFGEALLNQLEVLVSKLL